MTTPVFNNNTVIIDTGVCNLTSVYQALIRVTDDVVISHEPNIIKQAARVILPGVGTAKTGMSALKKHNLDQLIPQLTQPVLGICLGMQLLTNSSIEGGNTIKCLGVIPTEIVKLDSKGLAIPHMGWNQLQNLSHSIFDGISDKLNDEAYVYFVHSFCAPLSDNAIVESKHGTRFSAGVSFKNFIGLQFHPEKSGKIGSKILRNFTKMRQQ